MTSADRPPPARPLTATPSTTATPSWCSPAGVLRPRPEGAAGADRPPCRGGTGTPNSHFPGRVALLDAVLADTVQAHVDAAEQALATNDSGDRFISYLERPCRCRPPTDVGRCDGHAVPRAQPPPRSPRRACSSSSGSSSAWMVRRAKFDRSGHFAVKEAPDLLVSDVRTFVCRLRQRRFSRSSGAALVALPQSGRGHRFPLGEPGAHGEDPVEPVGPSARRTWPCRRLACRAALGTRWRLASHSTRSLTLCPADARLDTTAGPSGMTGSPQSRSPPRQPVTSQKALHPEMAAPVGQPEPPTGSGWVSTVRRCVQGATMMPVAAYRQ